jgi:hypothetical protein
MFRRNVSEKTSKLESRTFYITETNEEYLTYIRETLLQTGWKTLANPKKDLLSDRYPNFLWTMNLSDINVHKLPRQTIFNHFEVRYSMHVEIVNK